jgi:hypothetical protein
MRLNGKLIQELQTLLLEITGKHYTPEEAQKEGLAIVRFVSVKELYKHHSFNKESKDNDKSQ